MTSIRTWEGFDGELLANADAQYPTRVWAYSQSREFVAPVGCFGYVLKGTVDLIGSGFSARLGTGYWFANSDGARVVVAEKSRLLVIQRLGFRGLNAFGGPLESAGRLRYVDGCSDTLLCAPALKGDPCLNHLHFPRHTNQTMHLHPSVRVGAIARGQGICRMRDAEIALVAGTVFCIPAGVEHAFATNSESMDVVAYHPDSDWGPTHETHPMINRTWIDQGVAMDNRSSQHAAVELVHGDAPMPRNEEEPQ